MMKDLKSSISLVIPCCIMVAVASCAPMDRNLTYEEEMSIQKHTRQSQQILRPQEQAIEQKIIDCEREGMQRRDWDIVDEFIYDVSGGGSKCDNMKLYGDGKKVNDNEEKTIDTVIDKGLKEALEKAKNRSNE